MKTYEKSDPSSIQAMFGSIARQYDRANAMMSFNMHKLWNRKLISLALDKGAPRAYLDLCAGTGEIAFGLLERVKVPCEAFLLDFCQEMLACAETKAGGRNLGRHTLRYLTADAQEIPLPSAAIDLVTVAYGIRNVAEPLRCFNEVYRVLAPGGRFAILELTLPSNVLVRFGHRCYLKGFLPLIGKWVTENKEAYAYLCRSIQSFTPPSQLVSSLSEAGFRGVAAHPLMGGVATLITAEKVAL